MVNNSFDLATWPPIYCLQLGRMVITVVFITTDRNLPLSLDFMYIHIQYIETVKYWKINILTNEKTTLEEQEGKISDAKAAIN